ncbi:MAG: hypothetical protein KAR35_10775, partial [Candidatus Heimdallarchaeota archaeon]|nr:hypothetical protein [Candidatus Heimdallarchaeota archaeon]MCK5049842.1 hypothetical protein [Candidatus Heimdallarchaeota archaeon]
MKIDFDDLKTDLLARIDRGIKHGSSVGAEAVEVYIINTENLNINMQSGMIDATQGGQVGVGARVAIGKKIGFASASGISDDAVNYAIESALRVAKYTQEDEKWHSFVHNTDDGQEGIIDDSVLEITSEEAVSGANQIFMEAKQYDERVVSVSGNVFLGHGAFAVGNSEGTAKASASTGAGCVVYLTAAVGQKSKTAIDFAIGRGVPEFEGIGAAGAAKAINLL